MKKIKVLFICKGNICRSPTAHGIFRDLVNKENLANKIQIDSVGTHSAIWHKGDSADPRSVKTASLYDCDISDLMSEQLIPEHFEEYDYLVAMDDKNIIDTKEICPNGDFSKLSKILNYTNKINIKNVPDPYFENNFEKVFLMLDTACKDLLNTIKEENKI